MPFRRIKTCRREPPGVGVAMPTAQDGARTSSVTTSWWVAARTGLPFIPTPSWKLKMPTAPGRRRPHTYGGLMPRGSDACGATRRQPEPHYVRSHPTRERRGTDGQIARHPSWKREDEQVGYEKQTRRKWEARGGAKSPTDHCTVKFGALPRLSGSRWGDTGPARPARGRWACWRNQVWRELAAGATVASLARQDNVSWPTIMRVQDRE